VGLYIEPVIPLGDPLPRLVSAVYFDRCNSTGFGPPWFPNATVVPPGISTSSITPCSG
jgi:hypothetical protein